MVTEADKLKDRGLQALNDAIKSFSLMASEESFQDYNTSAQLEQVDATVDLIKIRASLNR